MKVLIIGGYGFIGSYIAKKFYKEGHKIYIIDNLSTGNIKNLNIKHKKYKIDIENNIIEEIFKNNKFDYVVFMLKRKEKVENFEVENKMNVSGLISVLNYSKKYGVKKFIYGSSCDVYGNFNGVVDENSSTKPYRVNGFNKLIEEQYCIKWNEIYNLDTVCVRISNVYGPSNNNKDEIIENFIRGKNNFSNSFSENMWDFIYVEDVAEAIYRIAFSKTSKILNLSSNNLITINDLISKTSGFMKINYDKNNYKKVKNIGMKVNNNKLNYETDWVPKVNIDTGLKNTFNSILKSKTSKNNNITKTKKNLLSKNSKNITKYIPLIENILGFLVACFLTELFSMSGTKVLLDFRLFYILIIGLIYGMRHSLISVILACVSYIISKSREGIDIISLIYDTNTFLYITYYTFIGLVASYTKDRSNRINYLKEENINLLTKKFNFLEEIYKKTKKDKKLLKEQLINYDESYTKVYKIMKKIDKQEPIEIINSAVKVIESIIDGFVSFYIIDKEKTSAKLVANSNGVICAKSNTILSKEFNEIIDTLNKKKVYVRKSIKISESSFIGALNKENELVGFVVVSNMNFEKINLHYLNIFNIVLDMISNTLLKSYRYDNKSNLIKSEQFLDFLDVKLLKKYHIQN